MINRLMDELKNCARNSLTISDRCSPLLLWWRSYFTRNAKRGFNSTFKTKMMPWLALRAPTICSVNPYTYGSQ